MIATRFTLLALTCILPIMTGCKPNGFEIVSETDEKHYQLAKDFQSQGRVAEALRAFLRVIESREDAPESHFEAGYIYLNAMSDPIRAIYHFKEYLRLKPESPQAKQVQRLIETAGKEFARQLPAQPYEGELDRMDMMEMVNSLKQENNRLKRELIATQRQLQSLKNRLTRSDADIDAQEQVNYVQSQPATVSPDPARVPRTYIVQSGDSLSGISRNIYGTPSRWIDIYQANRDRLPSENSLRVGQELRIP